MFLGLVLNMGKPKWIPIILIATFLVAYAASTRIHVNATILSPASPPDSSIVVPDDYFSIQEAVDNVSEGGTVFVRSGVYEELVIIIKSLSLIGEDPKNTVIVGGPRPGSFLTWAVVEVSARDVTVSGFTIENAPIGIWITQEYQMPPPFRCKIIGNIIRDNYREGIATESGENHVISGNTITGNQERGIYVTSSNSVISGNNITGNGLGINLDSCGNVKISNNTISGNGGGLNLRWDGPFHVYGNNITDNQGIGPQFGGGCYSSTVYQNNIVRNGIGVNLLNFPISGDATIGSGNTVYRNNIVDNLQQAFVDKEWKVNQLYDNGTDIVSWDNGTEGNYWSDYDGMGPYVIDENNTDHYPIMNPITISSEPPPNSGTSFHPTLMVAASVAVAVTVLVIVFFVYRTRRKDKKT
jgi:parallel beta-helix repeat protein